MRRTSTPDHEFELPFVYEEYADQLLITYSQNDKIVLELTQEEIGNSISINGGIISVSLSQEDTKKFAEGSAEVEIKLWTKNKKSLISDPISIYVYDVLNDKIFT